MLIKNGRHFVGQYLGYGMSSKTSVGTERMIGFSHVKTMGGIFINQTKWNCGFLRTVSFLCKTEQQ